MNWDAIAAKFERVRTGETDFQKKIRGLRRRLTLLLAVVGPGLITSNVDNDAGGISVYTQAGAQYGYALLWSLIPMTIALYVTEEMCARMGVVTGKGLSDLIRGIWIPADVFRDDHRFFCGPSQRGGGVCRRGGGDANFRDQPIRRRADRRDPRLGAGDSRDLPPSGDYFSVRLRSVSVVRIFRIFRQAGLADRRERNSDPEPQP